MLPSNVGTCDWLVEELVRARLLERGEAHQLARALRQEQPFADANALATMLVRRGVLTSYQAKCAQEGSAGKLVLGVYNLVAPLDGGTMGTVYKAVGRADRRSYAVKVLPLRNKWNIRLARKQVETFEQMPPHESVVPFVDVGSANKAHYLVWPFGEGRPLDAMVRERGPLKGSEIAAVGTQLAVGLRHCHYYGVVHGLVKPTNVLIGYDGRVRLLDFGIGALLAENGDESDSIIDTCSQAKVTASMLECASPELVLDPTLLTPAGDQYSLGCVLYYCATGRYPFPGGTAMEKVVAHQKLRPVPVRSLNPDLPSALADVIDRLMRKAPEDRYRRIDEALVDLQPIAGSIVGVAPPPVPVDVSTPLPKLGRSREETNQYPGTGSDENNPSFGGSAANERTAQRKRGLLSRLLFFWWT
jgi:serine/threonine-protein kinase